MKVLLDECVDWRLLRDLTAHEAKTVRQLGWEHVKNGALLKLAATEFDAFVTVDGNLPYQQNAATFEIAVIVLRGRTTRLPDLRTLCPRVLITLETIQRSELRILSWRDPA